MKRLTTILSLFIVICATAQIAFNKFYIANKDKTAFKMNLSGSIAGSFLDDKDQDDLEKLIKNSSDFKLMVFNDNSVVSNFKKFKRKNDLKTLVRVKDKKGRAEVFFIEKENYIQEIIIQAGSKNDKLVLVGLKTKITKDELSSIMSDAKNKNL